MNHVVRIHPARGAGQDRAVVVPRGANVMIVLADGAGGTARGADAAQRVVDRLTLDVNALDTELAALGGQSTVVAIEVDRSMLRGVSVGDSEAWIEEVADALVAAARLRGGGLQDDLSLVLCRRDAL
jgi:serine/threonine protein phosphatase PrpC